MTKFFSVLLAFLFVFVLYSCRSEAVKARNRLEGKYAVVWHDTNYPLWYPNCCRTHLDTVIFDKSKKNKDAVTYQGLEMTYFRNDTFIQCSDPCYNQTILHIRDEHYIDMYSQFIPPHSSGIVTKFSKGEGLRID